MTKLAQKALRKEDIRVLADKGYFSQPDIKDTIDLGAEPIMPKTDTSSSEKKGIFNRSLFKYDANKDIYLCPAGNELQIECRYLSKVNTLMFTSITLLVEIVK
jgi:hypothetical protein